MNKAVAEDGIAVAREFYGHIGAGEFEDAKKLLAPDFVVHEPRELPYGGEYHGFEGFLDLLNHLTAVAAIEPVSTPEYLPAGDVVMVKMIGRFTSPSTGRSVETGVLELVSFREGLIAELDVFYKDPGAVAGLAEG
jgi:ketosteroid isomerase-like protein